MSWIIEIFNDLLRMLYDFIFEYVIKPLLIALTNFVNWILGGLEWIYASIKPSLIPLLTIWFMFFGYKSMITSEKKSIWDIVKVPLLSYIASVILDSLLPTSISLPRLKPPTFDVILNVSQSHKQLTYGLIRVGVITSETVTHEHRIVETVSIRYKTIEVREEIRQMQYITETVIIRSFLVVSETSTQGQVAGEIVTIG